MRRRPDSSAPLVPPPGGARLAALRLLGRRDYSTTEVREKLREKGFADDEIADALTRLTEDRALDDARVAQAHARTASRIKSRGRLRIRREMQARGLAESAIQSALAALPAEDEAATLAKVLQRKRPSGRLTPADARRLFQQLLRRGFSADAIGKALRLESQEDSD